MGVTYERQSRENVLRTAEALKLAAEQLAKVASDMQRHGMNEAFFPWTQRQWACIEILTILANQCVINLPTQLIAKAQNRPSCFELSKAKSARDVAARKLRNAGVPAKPRGRPRKVLV